MMNEQVMWCFYDPETKTKTAELPTDEAQMTVLQMRPKDINRFYYCKSGENSWKPLKLLMSSSTSPFAGLSLFTNTTKQSEQLSIHTKLKMKAVDQTAQEEIERTFTNSCIDTQKTLAVKFTQPKLKTIDLVLMNKQGITFRTSAVNPTIEGTFCKKELPLHFQNSVIEVVILNTSATNKFFEKIKVMGKVLKINERQYIEFIFSSEAIRGQLVESLNFCENQSHRKPVV